MRIDLFSSNAASVTLLGTLQTPDDLISAWRDSGITYKEGQHVRRLYSVGGYRRAGSVHRVLLDISSHKHADESIGSWDFSLRYRCPTILGSPLSNPPRDVTARTKRLERFFSTNVVKSISTEIHCHVTYAFKRNTVDPIVVMPLVRFNDSSLPFTDISGIRLVKNVDDQTEYEVVLDKDHNGDLHVGISFDSNISLNARELGGLLAKANQILSSFIKYRNNK